MSAAPPEPQRDWPLRAALLAVAGAAIGLALHGLLRPPGPPDAGRLALSAFLVVGGIAFAFVVERTGVALSAAFALVAGLIVAGVVFWNGNTPVGWDSGDIWRLTCGLLTVAIAAPLFQAWRGARGAGGGIPYVAAHNHAWTDVVLWFAAWLFVAITWLLTLLLGQLFDLIGLHFIRDLLDKPWFGKLLSGLAFGGAIGLLRDRERVLGTLQRVVTTVLSVLAPVLAIGLLVFLCALPLTGLAPLWGATKSTTPILLSCVIGALLLANAVIGDAPEDEARSHVLRWASIGLGIAMLPLGVIAAVSTGLRIDQYGLSPDRLWAVVFCAIACTYGLAYWVALVRARTGWAVPVRAANLRLAIGLCGLAFVLSTPLLGFGAISTYDQLQRLADGRTAPDKFDWAAVRFDFGPSGKAAVEQLARSGATPAIRSAATAISKTESRGQAQQLAIAQRGADQLETRLAILPRAVPLPDTLRTAIVTRNGCTVGQHCTLLFEAGGREAIMIWVTDYGAWTSHFVLGAKGWQEYSDPPSAIGFDPDLQKARARARALALANRQVGVRKVERRQVFIGGEPVGEPFP